MTQIEKEIADALQEVRDAVKPHREDCGSWLGFCDCGRDKMEDAAIAEAVARAIEATASRARYDGPDRGVAAGVAALRVPR